MTGERNWAVGRMVGWSGAEIDLCVVGVAMETQAVLADDLTNGKNYNLNTFLGDV